MKITMLDKAIARISPQAGLRRVQSKAKLETVNKIMNSGYSEGGGSRSKRSMKGWHNRSLSPQSDIDENLATLRERSRLLYMNSPIATSAINANRDHVLGAGLQVTPNIDYEYIGIEAEESKELEKKIKREFSFWAKSKDADITGQNNFFELQQIALMTWLISGECLALPIMDKARKYNPYQLRIKLTEPDLLLNPNTSSTWVNRFAINHDNKNRIYNGVEINENGTVVAYHLANNYEDYQIAGRKWTRIPVRGTKTGNPLILHIFNATRPNQYRGIPYLAPVIESIKQLSRYQEAEIMAAVINGLFSVFITTENGESTDFGGVVEEDEPVNDNELALGNGSILELQAGERVEVVDAKRPNTNFDGFVTSMAKYIGAALSIPHELLLKQFTASYSASRGALLEAWNFFKMNRTWFAEDFCQPVYEMWLSEAVAKGRINMPGFFNDPIIRKAYCNATWTGPSQGQLDPVKEVNASVLKVENKLSTRESECIAINGTSFEDNIKQLKKEQEILELNGLGEKVNGESGN